MKGLYHRLTIAHYFPVSFALSVWGTGGPEFKSRRSDQLNQRLS